METLQPKLRFSEFKGNWEKVKLKDVSTYYNGGSFENNVKVEGKYELITLKSVDMSGNLAHSRRYLDIETPTLRKNTLVMILSEQSPGLLGMTALIPIDNRYVLNQRVAEIRPNNSVESYFLSLAINRNQTYFSKHGVGTKVQNISKPNVENYKFLCPTLHEQTKIANFLSAVETKINQLTQKKTLLEQYKKGIMQRIFNQELRFKDDDGNDFAEWEEKSLGEVGEVINGLTYSPNDIDENGILVLRSSNVQERRVVYNDNVYVNAKSYNPVIENDILICVRNGSKNLIGKNALIDKVSEGFAFGAFMTVYRSKYNKYLFHWFDSSDYKKIVETNLGATINSINNNDLKKFKVPFPSLEEQTKIANFLSAIDDTINHVSSQLEKTTAYKKGLLQQMFV
jgi:type I restriction enzyme S subunit